MGRTLKRRNIKTIYIRDELMSLWDEFNKLIEKDEDIAAQRYKKKTGLESIAISTLIYNYVMSKNPNFKLAVNDGQ